MSRLSYTMDDPVRKRLGLVVLKTDEVLEDEARAMLAGVRNVSLHVTRIPSAPLVTAETLAEMREALPAALELLPEVPFDSVGYACTSGATVIGPEKVNEIVHTSCQTNYVTDPISAAIAACYRLNLKQISYVSPYVEEVSRAMRNRFEAHGIIVSRVGSFEEAKDCNVARIDGSSLVKAAQAIGNGDCDGLFMSCTNLRALHVIEDLERMIGKPVLTSNSCLIWAMCEAAGIRLGSPDIALFRHSRGVAG